MSIDLIIDESVDSRVVSNLDHHIIDINKTCKGAKDPEIIDLTEMHNAVIITELNKLKELNELVAV